MKQVVLTLAIIAALSLNVNAAFDENEFKYNGLYYRITSSSERTLSCIGADESIEDLIIPKEVLFTGVTYTVTSIYYDAFGDHVNLKSIVIPNSVTEIGNYAFSGCSSLESITIPDNVTEIGNYAFSGCSSLESITIPNTVTIIGESAFNDCYKLKSVYISDLSSWCRIDFEDTNSNPLKYAHNLYLDNRLITDLVIPDDITEIKDYAFNSCNLTSVTIHENVKSMGSYAFEDCFSLSAVYIFDLSAWCAIDFGTVYLANVDSNPLAYAHNLYVNNILVTDLIIPEGVTEIKPYAFYGCYCIVSASIPETVTSIQSGAFACCSTLKSISIPESVSEIGAYAFSNCMDLSSIIIPKSVTKINDNIFYNCSSLTSVLIPENVTEIGSYAFYGCSNLTSINIPENVSKIGRSAFYNLYNTSNLNAVYITDLSAWCAIDFEDGYSNPLSDAHDLYLNDKLIKDLVIPNDIETIKTNAFTGCSMTSVTIHQNVNFVDNGAFYSCGKLSEVNVHSLTPPDCRISQSFIYYPFGDSVYENATLKVPRNSLIAYKSAIGWREFESIREVDFGGVDGVTDDAVNVVVGSSSIEVRGVSRATVDVYNFAGQRVYSGTGTTIGGLEKGMYVVRVAGQTFKVAL